MEIKEYKDKIDELSRLEFEYLSCKRVYEDKEFEILTTYDFKAEYGKDNDKIRRGHIHKELKDMLDNIDTLELEINKLKRELKYLELVYEYER